ncbi:Hypothetical protein NGAL_HAMBI1146_59970 [Neorhizobium galegae bv. officinalis]|nr:Hypothetical protein NGAL_HAMBI1146_59970 [Neorhizobium galegae bv. officinalis]
MKINKSERTRVVSEMAAYMREHGDNCTRETLLLQFSQNEVDTFSGPARAEANSLSQRAA